MNNQHSVFIAVYTRDIKKYCDFEFFTRLNELTYPNVFLSVVDNSHPDSKYPNQLERIIKSVYHKPYNFQHINVDNRGDHETLPLRSITESLILLRNEFLNGNYDYFLIFESDVYPNNVNCIEFLLNSMHSYDIVGGLYYINPVIDSNGDKVFFHDVKYFEEYHNEIIPTQHVLSGCAMYSRIVIENIPFRWSEENVAAFPDAWMSHDANLKGFSLANNTKVKCRHLHDVCGTRGWNESIYV